MRPLLLAAALLLLVPLAPAQGVVPLGSFETSAAGTASFTLTDASTGIPFCQGPAAFTLEANWYTGTLAWDAPGCEEASAEAFAFWCSDACFPACAFAGWPTLEEVRCSGGLIHDGAWTELTLRRDGTFTFVRATPLVTMEAAGTLAVLTWPA